MSGRGLSIRALAGRHGVHRRTVRQALASAVPPAKRSPVGRPAPKLGRYRAVIDGWLLADREAPRQAAAYRQADLAAAWLMSMVPLSLRSRCVSS